MRPFILLLTLALAGCAPVISKENLKLVDESLTYEKVRLNPQAYRGKHVLTGGYITRVTNMKEGAELEVVQSELDGNRRPKDTTQSQGRFLARTDRFLDPMVYRAGLPVTLVGEIVGIETRPLFQVEYNYPVFSVKELHLWKETEERRTSPSFHFGIGIGTFF